MVDEQRKVRRLWALLRAALSLVWRSGQRELTVSILVQIVSGVGLAVQLIVARSLLNKLIDVDNHRAGLTDVLPSLLVVGIVFALVQLANAVRYEYAPLLAEQVAQTAADDILDVTCAVDLESFESPTFHDHLQRALVNATTRPFTVVNGLLGVISGLATGLGVLVALVLIQPLVALIGVLAIAPMWRAAARNSRAYHSFARDVASTDRERLHLFETLTDKDWAKEIRAFGTAGFLRGRYERLYRIRMDGLKTVMAMRVRRSVVASVIASAIAVGTLLLVVWLADRGDISLATAGTAILAVLYLAQSLRGMVTASGGLYESALFLDDVRIFQTLRPETPAVGVTSSGDLLRFDRVRVDDVTFTYLGAAKPSLRNVSLELRPGEVVALVGENGSGKTTLAKLLATLYVPDSGSIEWEGADPARVNPESLRRSIAVIFQDFGKYWLSARDNIALGATDRLDSLPEIVQAAKAAGADSFVSALPTSYDTVLSRLFEGGTDLSLGQWQRIALARAFFRDAPLIIMDEPTASLDAKAEHRLFASMAELAVGRSVLLISHRFSSVRSADRIYVLRHGEIIEHGSHDELMALEGWYAEMFTLQAASYVGTG